MALPKSTLPRSTRESNRTGRCCTDSTSKCRLAARSSIWEGLFGKTTTTADHAVGRVLENLSGSPADGRFSPYHSLIPAKDFECYGLITEVTGRYQSVTQKKTAHASGGLYPLIPNGSQPHCVTVKMPLLTAVPPGVVIVMCPVFAPVGTLAVT